MRVIGTAGHVDHGKSTLVNALTGINPDRLKEEQQREMTIELGFAWMTLPQGEEIGIVDVPGHRDFIENMLSGVGGIDAVLFVVAADEGVMPQTREHLAILDILQIPIGVVALTKTDLVEDSEWLDLVEEDLRQVFSGTVLENAPILRVSARKRTGLEELVFAIENILSDTPSRLDLGRPRLSIDRVFTISGFGTVVTGTLMDGVLSIGDEISILPSGLRGRVRGLQTHKKKEEKALPGSRTAVNISGIDVDQIQRGEVLSRPGDYQITSRMDVQFKLIPDAGIPICHNLDVKVFLGAAETSARVRLLGTDYLNAGETGWLQLEMEQPLVAVRGDRYILRRPSPGETLGGGEVVDPHPKRRHKRFAKDILLRLEQIQKGTPEDLLFQAILQIGPASPKEIMAHSDLSNEEFSTAYFHLEQDGKVMHLESDTQNQKELLITKSQMERETNRLEKLLEQYHQKYPLRLGIAREELKSRLKFAPQVFNTLIRYWTDQDRISDSGGGFRLPQHAIRFNAQQQKRIGELLDKFSETPNSPPSVKESQQIVGEEVLEALLALQELVQMNQEVVFLKKDYERLVNQLTCWLKEKGSITVAQFRDEFQTSRRYALAFLEHLDQIGVTARVGDERKLRIK